MLPPDELQRRIAAEFLRVGACQQSWDQNFPTMPSTWVPGPTPGSAPVLDPDYRRQMETFAGPFLGTGNTGTGLSPELVCPPGTIKEYVNGRWQCTAVGGRVVDPEAELLDPAPVSGASGLPRFVGGSLGRVRYTPIVNRQLTGVRYGTLPQVVMEEGAPGSYGSDVSLDTGGAVVGGGGNDLIQP